MSITPVTREEKFIQAIIDGSPLDATPFTRVEKFLANIAGAEVTPPDPMTRKEKFLAGIAGADIVLPVPITREEQYLAAIAGMTVDLPAPVTRLEKLLAEWAEASAGELKTVTGAVVAVSDALARKAEDLTVAINPVQSGTGTPSPDNVRPITGHEAVIVTRTGVNLLDLSSLRGGNFGTVVEFPAHNVTTDDYFPINGGTTYTWAQTTYPTGGGRYLQYFDTNKTKIGEDSFYGATPKQFTPPSGTKYAKAMWYTSDNFTSTQDVVDEEPQIELGSTATAYTPYVGETYDVQFPVFSTNQWDEQWELGGLQGGTGLPYGATDRIRSKNFCPCDESTSYYGRIGTTGASLIAWWYDSTQTYIDAVDATNKVITSPSNASYFKISTYRGNYTTYHNDIAINYPSTSTSYEPYTRTVYGGQLDVTTGVLTVDRASVDMGSLLWRNDSNRTGVFYSYIAGAKTDGDIFATIYAHRSGSVPDPADVANYDNLISLFHSYGASYPYIIDHRFDSSTTAEVKTALDGIKAVYELATPITYQLTPTEITMLLGNNTLWADTGDSTLTYWAEVEE